MPCGKRCFLYRQRPKCTREELSDLSKEEGPDGVPEPEGEDLSEDTPPGTLPEGGARLVPAAPSAGVQRFPKPLPAPIVRRRPLTQHVHFVAARVVNGILNESKGSNPKVLGRGSAAYVLPWKPRENFKISGKPRSPLLLEDMPYRICFVVEQTGEVLPLQQCVDVKFEESHDVPWKHWYRMLESLLGRWEPTAVNDFLEEILEEPLQRR